ncbi:MAG: SCP2 sterol-binding domain-containing protein [Thauera sp.]|nr:SCP2 sterol-binding domain-containing protein [Thauera sp.]
MSAFPFPVAPSVLARLLPGSLRQRLVDRLQSLRIPDFTLPAPAARLITRLPQRPAVKALTVALNLALERVLPRDTLEPLSGRHLQMRVLDAGLRLDFTLAEQGFRRVVAGADAKPDLIISATLRDYLALALREEDPDTLFFSRRLRLEGDTDLGLLVKNTLDAVDWDALKETLTGRRP